MKVLKGRWGNVERGERSEGGYGKPARKTREVWMGQRNGEEAGGRHEGCKE
jgi:hypothetical protein